MIVEKLISTNPISTIPCVIREMNIEAKDLRIMLVNSTPSESLKCFERIFSNINYFQQSAYQPLGICYIGGTLYANGFKDLLILDTNLNNMRLNEALSYIARYKPHVIGISCSSFSFWYARSLAILTKKYFPDTLVVIGGVHADFYPTEILSHSCFDIVVRGEGEHIFFNIIREYISRGKHFLKSVDGVAYRNNNIACINGDPGIVNDLNSLAFPYRKIYPNLPKYFYKSPISLLMTRGCPYRCLYCSKGAGDKLVRTRSPQNVAEEIKFLIKKTGNKKFVFVDEVFTINKEKARELCNLINKDGIRIDFSIQTRVDLVDKELLKELKKAGCNLITFGVESGSQRILDKMKKGHTREQVIEAFNLCRNLRIHTMASFLFGFPGEEEKDVKESVLFLQKIKPNSIRVAKFRIDPGSLLHEQLISNKTNKDFWLEYVRMANPGPILAIDSYKFFDEERLEKICFDFNKKFYMSYLTCGSGVIDLICNTKLFIINSYRTFLLLLNITICGLTKAHKINIFKKI